MIEFIMANIWIISFYVYMGVCTGIASKIIAGKFNEESLVVAIFCPITITICSLVKIMK